MHAWRPVSAARAAVGRRRTVYSTRRWRCASLWPPGRGRFGFLPVAAPPGRL